MEGKDIKTFSFIMLALFLVAIATGVTYIGMDYLKSSACTQGDSGYVYSGGTCQVSSTNTTEVTLTAITKIGVVESAIGIALGLLSLVVIMVIFKLVIKTARGFGGAGGAF